MRKAVMLMIFLLLVPAVAAFSIKDAVESFFIDLAPEVVIGDQKNTDDNFAAVAFQNEFGVKTLTSANTSTDKTLVVIGGPCANPLWEKLTGETCEQWDQPEGKAVLIAKTTASGTVLLIGGTSGKDTRAAARHAVKNFAEAIFNRDRAILTTEGLPLASDTLKVYKAANTVEPGQSSAKGEVVIEVPDNPSGGTTDYAEGLQKYLIKGYPFATVGVYEQSDVSITFIQDKIFVKLSDPILISVEEDAPADHVVIASAASFWLAGQGLDVLPATTHNTLIQQDLEFG